MKLYEPAPPARKDELANVQDGIAVIVDGDTCPVVVESGMYAYIKNNTHGLAEGLYKNVSDSAFPTSGGTADGTVFEADSTGGLNALNASLKIMTYDVSQTSSLKEVDLTLSGYSPVMMSLTTFDGYKGFMRCDNQFPNKIYIFTDGYSSGTVNHKLMVLYQKN